MRAAVLRETPLLIGLLTLVGLATTNLLDWLLLLLPALPVLTGLALLSLLVILMGRGGWRTMPINWRSASGNRWKPWC